MNKIDYLKEAIINNYPVELSSSVFKELLQNRPSITIWISSNVLYITSTNDYNCALYYDHNIVKVCDIEDYDTIIDIYNGTFGFNPNEEKINNLIEILNREFSMIK